MKNILKDKIDLHNKTFIIVGEKSSYSEMYSIMCYDILDKENIIFINNPYKSYSIISRIFRKLLRKCKLQFCCEKLYRLYREVKQAYRKKREIYVIFFNAGLRNEYSEEFLYNLKFKYKIKIGIIFIDSFETETAIRAEKILLETDIADFAYTIEDKDVNRSNKIYKCYTPYASMSSSGSENEDYDVYFCGTIKDRGGLIVESITKFVESNVNISIDLVVTSEEKVFLGKLEDFDGVHIYDFNEMKRYEDVVKESNKSRALLDITAGGQTALTLRPYEAVIYNKKLLTNNKNIYKFKFYNPKYMRYFSHITADDIEWLKKEEKVDYGYQGEFSIKNIIYDMVRKEG